MSGSLRIAPTSSGERAAELARQDLGLGLDAPLSVLDAVEDVADVPVCLQAFPDDVAGLFYRRRGRSMLFVNGLHRVERQRFTLAHEFGHVRMDHKPQVESVATMLSDRDPQEVEANYFAGAFLAPRQAVCNWAERHSGLHADLELVVRLGAFFGISAEASRIRLERAGVIAPADSERLKTRIKKQEHWGMVGALGLSGYADSLSRLKRDLDAGTRTLPRLPAVLIRGVRRAHEQQLLEADEFERVLRGTPTELNIEDELAR
jgi:Zn-dependent peptidase ImmA (M78 family)